MSIWGSSNIDKTKNFKCNSIIGTTPQMDLQTYSDRSRAFAVDSYMSSRPTSIAVEKATDITAQFDSISYSKGASLLVQVTRPTIYIFNHAYRLSLPIKWINLTKFMEI